MPPAADRENTGATVRGEPRVPPRAVLTGTAPAPLMSPTEALFEILSNGLLEEITSTGILPLAKLF